MKPSPTCKCDSCVFDIHLGPKLLFIALSVNTVLSFLLSTCNVQRQNWHNFLSLNCHTRHSVLDSPSTISHIPYVEWLLNFRFDLDKNKRNSRLQFRAYSLRYSVFAVSYLKTIKTRYDHRFVHPYVKIIFLRLYSSFDHRKSNFLVPQ